MRLPTLCLAAVWIAIGSACHGSPASQVTNPAQTIVRLPGALGHYRIQVTQQGAIGLLNRLAAAAGVRIKPLRHIPQSVTLDLPSATLEQALDALSRSVNLTCLKLEDGLWVVGEEGELRVLAAGEKDTTEVDVAYRCEYIGADSLSGVIGKVLPSLKVITGPTFVSPTLEGNLNVGADDARALGATDQAFKTHHVVFSGPSNLVRRAVAMAIKFDHPRKLVRINTKLTELSGSLDSQLGLSWAWSPLELHEKVDGNASPPNTVNGFKIGSFAHNPTTISATLKANEDAGKAKTLANPSLTLVDGERSFILIGERRLYPKQTGINAQGLAIYDVAEIRAGIYLQVAVQVGLENELTLSLFTQVSTVKGTMLINNSNFPIIGTREAQTTVRLRSGEMMAIGGLMQSEESDKTSGLPLLARIPILGRLFGVKTKSKSNTELVLLVVPEIVQEGEVEPPPGVKR